MVRRWTEVLPTETDENGEEIVKVKKELLTDLVEDKFEAERIYGKFQEIVHEFIELNGLDEQFAEFMSEK